MKCVFCNKQYTGKSETAFNLRFNIYICTNRKTQYHQVRQVFRTWDLNQNKELVQRN